MPADSLESENPVIKESGIKKNKHEIIRMEMCSVQNVGKVLISKEIIPA